jgi:nucleotide-binding universal stress UspA family protein
MSADDPQGPAILCWDGSESAQRAIAQSARILGDGHRALVLFVHVPTEAAKGVLGGPSGPDAPVLGSAEAEALLERGVAAARDAGFDATGLRVAADRKTAPIILDTAEERDAPVIVMGQRGRSGIRQALLGTVSREVINSYHRPVLVVGAQPTQQ